MAGRTHIEVRPPTPEAKRHEHPELGIEAAKTIVLVCECGWEARVFDENEGAKTFHCCGRDPGVVESPVISVDENTHASLERGRHGGPPRITRYQTTYFKGVKCGDCVGGKYL